MTATYTIEKNDPVSRLRYAMRDTDTSAAVFSDEEMRRALLDGCTRHFLRVYYDDVNAATDDVIDATFAVVVGTTDVELKLAYLKFGGTEYADVVVDGALTTTVTSPGSPFVDADVGKVLVVPSGVTDFTAGRYTVLTVVAGAATLDAAIGTAGATAGVAKKYAWTTHTYLLSAIEHDTYAELFNEIDLLAKPWRLGIDMEAGLRWLNPVGSPDYWYSQEEWLEFLSRPCVDLMLTTERSVLGSANIARIGVYRIDVTGAALRQKDLDGVRKVKSYSEGDMSVTFESGGGTKGAGGSGGAAMPKRVFAIGIN